MLMIRFYKLGFTPFTKDRFRTQSDLGDLEKRSEIDTIQLCLPGSRGRCRMRGLECAQISGGKTWRRALMQEESERSWVVLRWPVSQQCSCS